MSLSSKLYTFKVVPVVQIDDAKQAVPLAKTLVDNGLPVAEITFRTDAAVRSIAAMRAAYPELCLGAGTVLNPQQVDQAQEAGAEFVVAPGLNPTTVQYCQQVGMPIVPGINNPSQIEQGLELGIETFKFFPAEASGGIAMVKALLAPYGNIHLMPTGGINLDNVASYLDIDRVVCCGGSWMVSNQLLLNQEWEEIGKRVRDVVRLLNINT